MIDDHAIGFQGKLNFLKSETFGCLVKCKEILSTGTLIWFHFFFKVGRP